MFMYISLFRIRASHMRFLLGFFSYLSPCYHFHWILYSYNPLQIREVVAVTLLLTLCWGDVLVVISKGKIATSSAYQLCVERRRSYFFFS